LLCGGCRLLLLSCLLLLLPVLLRLLEFAFEFVGPFAAQLNACRSALEHPLQGE